jgi:CRISPR-associated protein Cas1
MSINETIARAEADLLPARMINEFVYCPRLFYYEHVEGIFVHNQETVEGEIEHARVDAKPEELPPAEQLVDDQATARARSVTLGSEGLGVIAKMDVVECQGNVATPIDYKRGRPCAGSDGSLDAWPTDKVQLAVQALLLRAHGYECQEAIVYYASTRQRVRIPIDEALERWTLEMIAQAKATAASRQIPPPLLNSPKCPRCSLVGVCLPDETRILQIEINRKGVQTTAESAAGGDGAVDAGEAPVRRLVPARDDLRPLYLNTHGLYVGIKGEVLTVKERDKLVQEVRLNEINQLNIVGNIQVTTQAIQQLCQHDIPIAYFSSGGWLNGTTRGLGLTNIMLRRDQFRLADDRAFCLRLAQALVTGKIRNQRTMLMRNHAEPPRGALVQLKCLGDDVPRAESLEQLLGIEGNAARVYFENFQGMIKVSDRRAAGSEGKETGEAFESGPAAGAAAESSGDPSEFLRFDFDGRNRRPPRDPVNALLSLAYSMLAKDCLHAAHLVGFDPYLGFFHQPRYGRASLALDLMEPFRPLIADSAVLSAINTGMVDERDFVRAAGAVALTTMGRKKFFQAYELRMDTLATHPIFGYRVSYRRMLEVQTRLLARFVGGQIPEYPVFTTR